MHSWTAYEDNKNVLTIEKTIWERASYRADSTHVDCRQIGSPQHDYFNGAWYQQGLSLERDDNGYLTDLYYDDTVNSGMLKGEQEAVDRELVFTWGIVLAIVIISCMGIGCQTEIGQVVSSNGSCPLFLF